MKQSTKRLASAVLALVFVVGAFVLFLGFIKPAYGELAQARGEEQARRQFVENQKAVVERVKTLIASYESAEKIQGLVSLALPTTPGVAEVVGQIAGIGTLHNLAVQGFSAAAEEPAKTTGGVPAIGGNQLKPKPVLLVTVGTKFVGTYKDMKEFLKDIETNARLMDITSLSISPAGKPLEDLYAFDVSIVSYYQP